MRFYTYFLKIYGLKEIILNDETNSNEDDIEQGQQGEIVLEIDGSNSIKTSVITEKKQFFKNNMVRHLINISYIVFIICILSWLIIASIVESAIESDGRYFTSSMFTIMYLLQYIAGIIFYRQNFFKDTIKNIKEHHIKLLVLYISSFVLSLLISSLAVTLLLNNLNVSIYDKFYNGSNDIGKVFIAILLVINRFYAYNIFFINVITFSSILINQQMKINNYRKKLEEIINNNNNDITISDMIIEYTNLQNYHKMAVGSLNNIFSSITIVGLIGCYFTILNYSTPFVGIFSYIDIGFFVIIEIIYIYSISGIKRTIGDIKKLIGSPKFVIKFLGRSELANISGDVYNNYNGTDNNISNDVNDEIEMFDVNKDITNVNTKSKRRDTIRMINDDIHLNNGQCDINKKVDIIKNMLYRNIILSTESGIDLDWMILYDKLLEPWECFNIFGFDIDDNQLVQKFVFVVFGLLGILRLNAKIGF